MRRLTKDEYFLSIAHLVATRATCDRLWAGCVLVKDGEILATGYNGAPSQMDECDEVGHLMVMGDDGREHCLRTIHAEENAILQARRKASNLVGVTAYTNATPCENCLPNLLRCGIKRIVCGALYRNGSRKEVIERLLSAWGAVMEYHPSPDITLTFGAEVQDAKRASIVRVAKEGK